MRIKHPRIEQVIEKFDSAREMRRNAPDEEQRYVEFFAKSHTGKSTAVKYYLEKVVVAEVVDGLFPADMPAKRRNSEGGNTVKITRSGDCKNSPKNAFVEDFIIDLLAANSLMGRVEEMASLPVVPDNLGEIEITHAISHGKIGAANGSITTGGSKKLFAAFIEFTSTKATLVRGVTLYSTARVF